jgi:hypothetical protein
MQLRPSARLVTRAIEVAEAHIGIEALARRLGVHPFNVRSWRDGTGFIPGEKFLALVDLLAELDPGWKES